MSLWDKVEHVLTSCIHPLSAHTSISLHVSGWTDGETGVFCITRSCSTCGEEDFVVVNLRQGSIHLQELVHIMDDHHIPIKWTCMYMHSSVPTLFTSQFLLYRSQFFNLTFNCGWSLHGRCLCKTTGEPHSHRVPSTVHFNITLQRGNAQQSSGEATAGQLGIMTFACSDANC